MNKFLIKLIKYPISLVTWFFVSFIIIYMYPSIKDNEFMQFISTYISWNGIIFIPGFIAASVVFQFIKNYDGSYSEDD